MNLSATPQRPHSQTGSDSAAKDGLQPVLKDALGSLNINLDYELARYRYAKRGIAQPKAPPHQFQSRPRSLSLASVPARSQSASASTATMPPPPPRNPRLQSPSVDSVTATAPVGETSTVSGTVPPESEVSALRSALVTQSDPTEDTFLASSHVLMSDFEAAYSGVGPVSAPEAAEDSWIKRFNTPLGLGALLLLLVFSAGLGFLLVNPAIAQNLFRGTPIARLWQSPSEDESDAETGDSDVFADDATKQDPPLTPLSPDLSQQEFTDLDFDDLSTLPSSVTRPGEDPAPGQSDEPEGSSATPAERPAAGSSPAPTATARSPQRVNQIPRTTTPPPYPAVPSATPAPASAAPSPAPARPQPSTAQPAPAATPAQPETAASQPLSPYYVVTDYTGDPSLDEARQVVGDAYVRNFDAGARIQLGAFSSEDGAAALVEDLTNQGIEASVLEP